MLWSICVGGLSVFRNVNWSIGMDPVQLARLAGVVGAAGFVLLEVFQWLAFAYAERDRWSC